MSVPTTPSPSPPERSRRQALAAVTTLIPHVLRFTWRVFGEFRRNRGFLLAGALGYNTLLSIVPLCALVVAVLSSILDPNQLVHVIETQADGIFPGGARGVAEVFAAFIERRTTIGAVGFAALLFFSAIAFRMLDDAFAVVFHRNRRLRNPHPLRALILPLTYVALIGVGILVLTLIMVGFDALPEEGVRLMGRAIDADTAVPIIKVLAFMGLVLLLSSFYWFMPLAHVPPRRALVGGLVAATLWEVVRTIMMWYFATLSLVHVVYGSLATVIVVLLGLEAAAMILLFGAEIIAELERAASEGRKWHDPPADEAATEGAQAQATLRRPPKSVAAVDRDAVRSSGRAIR